MRIFALISDVTSAGASLVYGQTADWSLSGAFCLGAAVCVLSGTALLLCRSYLAGPDSPSGS